MKLFVRREISLEICETKSMAHEAQQKKKNKKRDGRGSNQTDRASPWCILLQMRADDAPFQCSPGNADHIQRTGLFWWEPQPGNHLSTR